MGRGMTAAERRDPETNLRVALKAHVHHRNAWNSVEAAVTAHNAGGPAVGAAYGAGGDWTNVVHHVKRDEAGNVIAVVYVADIYTRPIMRDAETYR